MQATRALWQQQRQPLIKFLGKRNIPKQIDHTPTAHPASPENSLPESFAQYRDRATQHGPLKSQRPSGSSNAGALGLQYGGMGAKSGRDLGPVEPAKGQFSDRSELPSRFRRMAFTEAEMEAVDSGGASMIW